MKAYGRYDARSGPHRFNCCEMINGCLWSILPRGARGNSIKRLKAIWKKRARQKGKEEVNETYRYYGPIES